MERGILVQADVAELLRQFELFEIYNDNPAETHYAELQKRLTGQIASPTYLVLDSEHHREVDRYSFTPSAEAFKDFLKRGLVNQPAFRSELGFEELKKRIRGDEVTVLVASGDLEYAAGEQLVDSDRHVYRGEFWARQQFRVPVGVKPGQYSLVVRLSTSVYTNDGAYLKTLAPAVRIAFEVLP
ncbi:MAG: hypothetical protein ACKVX7_17020 [Planctomycetota bacterium]